MPVVSVVIPTFNRAHVVAEAIESVLAQTSTDFELILVDDGSCDDTEAIIKRFADPRIRYFHQKNVGPGPARNRGVEESRTDLIAFLDSDDLWMPEKLSVVLSFFAAHPEVEAVFHDLEWQREAEVQSSFVRAFSPIMRRWVAALDGSREGVMSSREMYLMLLEELPIKTPALAVKKTAFLNSGGFSTRWDAEDWEFLLRLGKRNQFGYVDQPLAVIRVSAESAHVRRISKNIATVYCLLENERNTLASNDSEALAAIKRGMVSQTKESHRRYLEGGQRWDAARLCLAGFSRTRSPELLFRAIGAFAPEFAVKLMRGLVKRWRE